MTESPSTPLFSLNGKRVWVAGHNGMVGAALVRRLQRESCEIITCDRSVVDLRDQRSVTDWVGEMQPDAVFMAAGTVGGVAVNNALPVDFLRDNLLIETNVIGAVADAEVEKLMFLGSSCIYPKQSEQPIKEEALLSGPLEPSNQWYAIAKIAGVKLCQAYRTQYGQDFISVIPTNLYGPGDNFDPGASHVLSALMLKAHRAKIAGQPEIEIWGSGRPQREFLYVDDLADGLIFLMERYSDSHPINIGSGEEQTIANLATQVCATVGYQGTFTYDATKPDGVMRKVLDCTRLHGLGWRATTPLAHGLQETYTWFLENNDDQTSGSARSINARFDIS